MEFDGKSIRLIPEIGWLFVYRGIRWIGNNDTKRSVISHGLLVLDIDNHEKTLYRSTEPINDIKIVDDWIWDTRDNISSKLIVDAEKYIPKQVIFEIKRGNRLATQGINWKSHHTQWLKDRANFHN